MFQNNHVINFKFHCIDINLFRNNFLDHCLDQLKFSVTEKCHNLTPVIPLMDNINMYHGRKHHDRLFKEVGQKM